MDAELQGVESLALQLSDGIATYIGGDAAYGQTGSSFQRHVVVLFGLAGWGGGNGSRQFLAVLERHEELLTGPRGGRFQRFHLLAVVNVGEDFDRWFKNLELRQEQIVLRGSRWLPADAHCCPSAESSTTYRLERRGLIEIGR